MSSAATTSACHGPRCLRKQSISVAGVLFGIAQGRELLLEPRDLVGLLGLYECVLVFMARIANFADFLISVTQMLGDRWIVAGQIDRALEFVDRPPVLASLIIDPSQTVDVETVFGLDLEGALDQLFGFIQTLARLGIGITQVIERGSVAGIDLNRLAHLGFTEFLLLGLVIEGAEREMELVVTRLEGDHFFRKIDRARIVFFLLIDPDQKAHNLGVIGLLDERLLQILDRVVEFALLVIEIGELQARIGVMFVGYGNLLKLLSRLVILVEFHVDRAEVVMHAILIGL